MKSTVETAMYLRGMKSGLFRITLFHSEASHLGGLQVSCNVIVVGRSHVSIEHCICTKKKRLAHAQKATASWSCWQGQKCQTISHKRSFLDNARITQELWNTVMSKLHQRTGNSNLWCWGKDRSRFLVIACSFSADTCLKTFHLDWSSKNWLHFHCLPNPLANAQGE